MYTEKRDAFDAKKVDGAVEEDDPEADLAERKKKRMYAFKAHLEHEFDAVRRNERGAFYVTFEFSLFS